MSSGGASRNFLNYTGGDCWSHPCWDGYRGMFRRLSTGTFPTPAQLNGLLPRGTVSGGGAALRFVPAGAMAGSEYERRIFETGEVSTREGSWHDLFNALAWCRLPRLKAALNAVHYRHLDQERDGRRGPRRDALTLLDESGALVVSRNPDLLRALARRDWQKAFVDMDSSWSTETYIVVCGHALLEKYLNPWKSITAHALLLSSAQDEAQARSAPPPRFRDAMVAAAGEARAHYRALLEANPDWRPAITKSALMTTARQDLVASDGVGVANPFDYGAGHIVPNAALQPGLVYDATDDE